MGVLLSVPDSARHGLGVCSICSEKKKNGHLYTDLKVTRCGPVSIYQHMQYISIQCTL